MRLHPPLSLAAGWLCAAMSAVAATGAATAAASAPDPMGRWEGEAAIPGAAPLPLVLDLAPDGRGSWAGSVTLPGRGVKGAPLDGLNVTSDGQVQAGLRAAFNGTPVEPAPLLALRMLPDGRLEGELRQGGHAARLQLQRSGPPQVDLPPPDTPLPPALAGTWRGRYELGGYPREVTLTLAAAPAAPGELLIVGKRRTQLPIDKVRALGGFMTLEASSAGIRLEGRWDARSGRFDGEFIQGPFEAPLRLQRDVAGGGS
jgi:hypothetical protein